MSSRAISAVVLAAFAAGTTACASPSDIAYERATAAVRTDAEQVRRQAEALVVGGKSQAEVAALLKPDRVLRQQTNGDGFEIDAVFYNKGEAGGGGSYQQKLVRLCARLTVYQRPSPKVALVDADCPSSLSNDVPGYGPMNRTVRLHD